MTVARVVNGTGNVNPETVDKVRQVMQMVGYIPKPPEQRRGPRRDRCLGFKTGNVAFITSAKGLHILGNSPIMVNVMHGIEETLASYGISMIQCVVNSNRQLPPIVSRGEIDGVIIWPSLEGASAETIDILSMYKRVYVMTGREKYLPGDRVLNDNEQVGILAANYLISRGHKRLIMLDSSDPARVRSAWINRWYGFEETAEAAGVSVEMIISPTSTEDTALMRTSEAQQVYYDILKSKILEGNKPTGIFCTCDSTTAATYPILRRLGLNVGTDVEIVSCNNEQSILSGLDPLPASIDIRPEIIGKRAVEQLRRRIMNPEHDGRVVIEIKPRLRAVDDNATIKTDWQSL